MAPFNFRRKGRGTTREGAVREVDTHTSPSQPPVTTGSALLILVTCILLGVLAGVLFSRFVPRGTIQQTTTTTTTSTMFPGLKRVDSRPLKGVGGVKKAPPPPGPAAPPPPPMALPPLLAPPLLFQAPGVAVGAPLQAALLPPPPPPPALPATSSLPCTPAQVAAQSSSQDALLAQVISSGARKGLACPSKGASHQAYMDLNRAGIPEPRELLNQVQELALNFGLSQGATLVHVGMDPQHPDFALVQSSFATSVGVGGMGSWRGPWPP